MYYSGSIVGKGRAKALGYMENGCADDEPSSSDARTRHDTIQILSIVHEQHGHRDEMFGTSHVSI